MNTLSLQNYSIYIYTHIFTECTTVHKHIPPHCSNAGYPSTFHAPGIEDAVPDRIAEVLCTHKNQRYPKYLCRPRVEASKVRFF